MHSRDLHDPFAMTVVSSHRTSEGVVSYLRCGCGAWEVRTARLVGIATPGARSKMTID
ncbi:hypothetical protein [Nonomuraea gerenzanensis]|uniref:Uncharacterized protein n=1 Tax=Nonomuraea gerenzanensis TaxID=93944 RepID=A0A1M4E7R8_9ACTN|nr:hypothetical protein [Nonomuraea gerenzanensis]UBU17177.1 hypothetical protein LCN96_19790 [Nonomuraea gerenzanensis]SBO94917.1 hypothetical protein BN4615_P4433 [Nonomuraea gerenzanensis]